MQDARCKMYGKNAELLPSWRMGEGYPLVFRRVLPRHCVPAASLRSSTSDQKRKEKTNLTGH